MLSCIIVSGSGSATPDEEDIVVGSKSVGTRSCQKHVLRENGEKKSKGKTPNRNRKTTRRLPEIRGNGLGYVPSAAENSRQKCLRWYNYYYLPKRTNDDTTKFGWKKNWNWLLITAIYGRNRERTGALAIFLPDESRWRSDNLWFFFSLFLR